MDNKFLFHFVFKNLFSHKLRTTLTTLGMIIGVSAIVFLLAFGFGIQKLVTLQISGENASQLIDVGTGNSQIVKLNQDSFSKIKAIAEVKDTTLVINAAGKINLANKENDISVSGASGNYLDWAGDSIIAGKNLSDQATSSNSTVQTAVANMVLAQVLGYTKEEDVIGKTISLDIVLPQEIITNSASKVVKNQKFNIIGLTKGEASAALFVNSSYLISLGATNFSQVRVKVADPNQVLAAQKKIEALGFKTQYVGDTINQVNEVFNFFKLILGGFGLIALVVASLGMFNTLTISLLERTKEVALLKILGMRAKSIMKVFTVEALVMGILGGTFGILLGIGIGKVINAVLNSYALKAGGEAVAVFYFPVWFLIVVFIFAVLIGFFCGLYPAIRATRINALDVLRYE